MRLIYTSGLGIYFLNLLLFTQLSAVDVTVAICGFLGKTAVSIISEPRQLPPKSEFVTEE